jgi:hypothetical protein
MTRDMYTCGPIHDRLLIHDGTRSCCSQQWSVGSEFSLCEGPFLACRIKTGGRRDVVPIASVNRKGTWVQLEIIVIWMSSWLMK